MKRWLEEHAATVAGLMAPTIAFALLKLLGAIDWPWWWIAFVPAASLIAAGMLNDRR